MGLQFPYCTDNLSREISWGALDDVVMGGVSEGTFQIDPNGGEDGSPTGIFKGLFHSYLQENTILLHLLITLNALFRSCFHCKQWRFFQYPDKGKS